jgi:hypothetical protein
MRARFALTVSIAAEWSQIRFDARGGTKRGIKISRLTVAHFDL